MTPPVLPPAIRLFRFRPTSLSFDTKLRTLVVPELVRLPGILALFAGRAGPDGTRLVASLWPSVQAMDEVLGVNAEACDIPPQLVDLVVDRELDVLSVAFTLPPERPGEAGILRLVRGTARPGRLDAYVSEAVAGTLADRANGIGPQALYLGIDPPARFVTLSLWDEWAHVEAATGADVAFVERTRHAELLEAWSVEHYEVIPGLGIAKAAPIERQPA